MNCRRRAVKYFLTALAVILIFTLLRGCVMRPANSFPGSHFNRSKNAAWLGVEWVNEAHPTSEIERLANDLHQHQIVYVYVYVSYLRIDNTFRATYSYAADFIA